MMEGLRTLEWNDDLKENMQEASKIMLEQLKEQAELSEVRNRHEGYGISAEGYVSIQKAMKSVKTDMADFLKLLPATEQNALNCISSLYNSALDVSVEAVKLAAQCQRILADLYDKERILTPIEETIKEAEDRLKEAEDFKEVEE